MVARKFTISAGEKVSQSAPVKKLTAMLFLPILHAQNPSTSCFSSFFTSPMWVFGFLCFTPVWERSHEDQMFPLPQPL